MRRATRVQRAAALPAGQLHEHGHRALDLGRGAADLAGDLVDEAQVWHQSVGRVGGVGEPHVPELDMRERNPQHPGPDAADHQRRTTRLVRPWQELGVASLEVAALEVDRAVLQQRPDDREGLLEAIDPMIEREAERSELRLVPAGPEAEDQAALADLVHGRGELGEHRRRVERRRRDEGAEPDPGGRRREAGEHRPDLPRATCRAVLVPIEEVIAEPDRVEPDVLGRAGHRHVLGPAHLALDLGQLDADAKRAAGWRHGPRG